MTYTHFIVILHELYNDPYVVRVIFDRNDPHYVRSVFGVRVLAVLVRQHQTGISLVDLKRHYLHFTLISWLRYIYIVYIIQITTTATTLFAYIEYSYYFKFNLCTLNLNTKAHFPNNSIIILFNIMMSSATIKTHACIMLLYYTHTIHKTHQYHADNNRLL
jgi:hypothetical protein